MTEKRFDEAAATWDDKPRRVELAAAITTAIKGNVSLSREMAALEIGCGTGLVTCGLAADLGRIVATDTSAGMLKVLADKISALGIDNIEPRRHDLLVDDDLPAGSFDLIYSAMTLHHIDDTEALLAACRRHLRPGGILALADLDKEDGSFHDDMTGVAHCGFEHSALAALVTASGFQAPRFVTAHQMEKQGPAGESRTYPVFLMTAMRP